MAIDFACTSPKEWVVKSLDNRAESIANPRHSWTSKRSVPWARIISSAIVNGDASIRYKYALWSGGLDTFKNSYIQDAVSGVDKSFRPKSGVESIKVSYKGTMGSTKSCVVNFKVWSLEELQIMEKLYMVPGISVIVEWGWPIDTIGQQPQPIETFLKLDPMDDPYSYIMDTIIKRREVYEGNYDGLVGVITNFNYALNEYLGFDCSFELCAPGELWLEQSVSNVSKKCIGIDAESSSGAHTKQSNLEGVFDSYVKLYGGTDPDASLDTLFQKQRSSYPNISDPLFIGQVWEVGVSEYEKKHRSGFYENVVGLYNDAVEYVAGPRDNVQVYVAWNKFVQILNENINQYILEQGNPTSDSLANPEVALAMDFIPVTILPKMYPLDPRVLTFVPHNPDYKRGTARRYELSSGFFNSANIFFDSDKGKNREFKPLASLDRDLALNEASLTKTYNEIQALGTGTDKKNADAVLEELKKEKSDMVGLLNNVYLNLSWLRTISQIIAGEKVTADDYLKKILDELNACSGNLWNLQYRTDEKNSHLLHIYDANWTTPDARGNNLKPYEFKFKKDASPLLRNLTVQSKLVDGFKSMVLYGNSTNDNGNFDTTHQAMTMYSNKIIDGFKTKQNVNTDGAQGAGSTTPGSTSNTQTGFAVGNTVDPNLMVPDSMKTTIPVDSSGQPVTEKLKGSATTCERPDGTVVEETVPADPEADVDMVYSELIDAVTDESVASAKSAVAAYLTYLNTNKTGVASSLPMNQNILLPFNCSFNLDGFSGFSWGNVVKVDYLPERYFEQGKSRVYFQITKIEHEISITDWVTTIETIMRVTPELKSMAKVFDAESARKSIIDEQAPTGTVLQRTTYAASSTGTQGFQQQANIRMLASGIVTQNASGAIVSNSGLNPAGLSGGADISKRFSGQGPASKPATTPNNRTPSTPTTTVNTELNKIIPPPAGDPRKW